jgi:hypothetical protein
MRVGAREGFALYSVKLVLLANGNRYEVDSNMFFLSDEASYPCKILPCPKSDFLWHTHFCICSLWLYEFIIKTYMYSYFCSASNRKTILGLIRKWIPLICHRSNLLRSRLLWNARLMCGRTYQSICKLTSPRYTWQNTGQLHLVTSPMPDALELLFIKPPSSPSSIDYRERFPIRQ